ncbi:hypothetical protein [Streptomyces capitiformicae]|uniref:Uncharacterized protein n=1 Tax=Streptomyces capitiformicae TaxID=2014920 RepID=A0A919GQM0_9ACTN|nr:hypothetical protein [Streptomyces capitiformicae]GHH88559.1 hypothetical protein GCM10017771_34400 [Streptomyces capitiformicae]
MNALVEADDRQGGHTELEKAAVQGRDGVLELRQRDAGECLRRALCAAAAEYTIIAAWSWTHPKVQPLHEVWGYAKAGEQQPFTGTRRQPAFAACRMQDDLDDHPVAELTDPITTLPLVRGR